MNITRRTSPTGIDEVVDNIQVRLYNNLSFPSSFNIFDRAYKTESDNGVKLERYVGGNEYKDVFVNDKTAGHIVFYLNEKSDVKASAINGTLSVFCFADLSECYPSVIHRADQELHRDLYTVLRSYHITNITHGIDALRGYNVKFQDIHPWHVCRFDLKLNYSLIQNC